MSRVKPVAPGARFRGEGFLDVLLVVVVATAMWTRTPVGGALQWAASSVTARVAPPPSLTAYFMSAAPEEVADWAETFVSEQPPYVPPPSQPEGALDPVLARLAVEKVLDKRTPTHTSTLLAQAKPLSRAAVIDDWLVDVDADGLEAALEVAAIGADQRDRAIRRAEAAGRLEATSYSVHRPYLPLEAQRDADHLVNGTRVLMTVAELWWPTDAQMWVSSRYGMRFHPKKKRNQLHNGVDLAIPVGTDLYAPHEGTVHSSGEDASSGKWVSIEHAPGVRTSYCHLDEVLFTKGETVAQGELFARSGNTGKYNTGAHLHYIVRLNDDPIDPLRVYELPETAFARPGVVVQLPGPKVIRRTGAAATTPASPPAVPAVPAKSPAAPPEVPAAESKSSVVGQPSETPPPPPASENPALRALVEQAKEDARAAENEASSEAASEPRVTPTRP